MNPGRRHRVAGGTREAGAEALGSASSRGPWRLVFLTLLLFGILAALAFAWINRGELRSYMEKLLTQDVRESPVVQALPKAPADNTPEPVTAAPVRQEEAKTTTLEEIVRETRFIVEFEAGSADLADEGALVLDKAVRSMGVLPDSSAFVVGHNDEGDTHSADDSLPFRRAVRVARYLMMHGIERGRLQVSAGASDGGVESDQRATVSGFGEGGQGVVEIEIRDAGHAG